MNTTAPRPSKHDLVATLKSEFDHELCGYLHGKRAMRDALVARYGWSELEAEQSLDELEQLGRGDPLVSAT